MHWGAVVHYVFCNHCFGCRIAAWLHEAIISSSALRTSGRLNETQSNRFEWDSKINTKGLKKIVED